MDKVIVVMIVKNEMRYLREFVDYHLGLGFDQIVIGDNNDVDGERYDDLLADLISEDKVKIINLRGLQGFQKKFYNVIKEHVKYTNSEKGKQILDDFGTYLPKFKKIIPHEYNNMLMTIVQMEEKGLSSEQAQIEAFYANTANHNE